MENKELLIRYRIVQKGNENENPNFENFECCKTHPLCSAIHSSIRCLRVPKLKV